MNSEKPGIIIVEDHPVVREGLAAFFAGTGRWQVMGTASSLEETKKILEEVSTDILLLDIQLDDGWGLDIIKWGKTTPMTAVYTAFDDYAHVSAAISLGVRAYVTKRKNEKELEEILLKVLAGTTYIDETARKNLQTVTVISSLLTRRETEILSLVKNGRSNKEIGEELGISRRTVENILCCVYDKTGIKTRLELERL
jgi:NarL family two-component system response regulator LiaR